MSPVTLSVCIPTYNFGHTIGETLQSVCGQLRDGVEILVFDSASVDDTQAVVHRFAERFPAVRYERSAKKRGIDRDMATAVSLTRGRWCWLLSADDLAVDGAIDRILDEIGAGADVLLFPHSDETFAMQPINARHPIVRADAAATFDLADRAAQRRWFRLAESSEALFSFMSGLVVRKAKWEEVGLDERFVGSCWAHSARLFSLATTTGLVVRFLPDVLVRRRGDNDSFRAHGLVRRYALGIDGFTEIGRHFWGRRSMQAFHVRRVLRGEFTLRMLLHAKVLCLRSPQSESRALLDRLANVLYSDPLPSNIAKWLAYRCMPASSIPAAQRVWSKAKKALVPRRGPDRPPPARAG